MIDKDLKLVIEGMKQMWKVLQDTWIMHWYHGQVQRNTQAKKLLSALIEHFSNHRRWRMSVDSLTEE